jgi:hypothetical protein
MLLARFFQAREITCPVTLFKWPIMMPAQGLTLAESDDWGRVHRLDQLNRKKPAKLIDYKALTLN